MERLGDIVARVLANVRVTMEEEKTGAVFEAAPEFAARGRGGDGTRAGGKVRTTGRVATRGRASSPATRRPTVEIYEHTLDHGSE